MLPKSRAPSFVSCHLTLVGIGARRVALLMIDLDDFEFEEEEDDSSMEEDPKMYEDYPRRESIHGGESQDV